MPCAPALSLNELDELIAFTKGEGKQKAGKTCLALLQTLRVVHVELMPWREGFDGLEIGFSGLDPQKVPVPETRFVLSGPTRAQWKAALPTDLAYALETVRTQVLRAFWPVFEELGADGKAVSVLNLAFSRLEAGEDRHWFEHLGTAAPRVSPSLWAAWQYHKLNGAMVAGNATLDAPARF